MLIKPVAKQHGFTSNFRRQTAHGVYVLFFHHENQIIFPAHSRCELLCFMPIQREAMRTCSIAGMHIGGLIHQSP
ncbi:Uncharacterised protein [Serratia entomophila]|nr:Uncharacterised protein [Serratia entomophila]CAI1833699.1 Uncharacterised protein [Serratia entomophila]CAI1853199.1 Uncharacterised protein [Serratia entomophila]CAI1901366.1 Uncharacterised protein [Serratia entomophila]CAI1933458.1 Uncharacterised protein [Serratia entomophila]